MSDPPSPPVPKIDTDRLHLRRLTIEGAPALHEAYADAGAMQFWNARPSPDLAETEKRVNWMVTADTRWQVAWAVLRRDDGQFISMVNYHARQPWNRGLAVGWILPPRFVGRGYMTEARRLS
jgi:ribosomal-protein-alanine N-acetyltransferase